MIHGLSLPRMVRLVLVCVVPGGLIVGCNTSLDSARYPAHLRYPPRTDILVKDPPTAEPRKLPGPGHLDEHILQAVKAELEAKNALDKLLDPLKISPANRKELQTALQDVFGTPSYWKGESPGPKVAVESEAVDALKLDEGTLRRGSTHYRRHCLHCHGLAGDGRGPTGPWVSPHPRDYRSGLFKFISNSPDLPGAKPRRADLMRTVTKGIDTTSMPAFELLPAQEREELVSYVIHLSLRGEAEFNTMEALLSAGEAGVKSLEGGSIKTHVESQAQALLTQWQEASVSVNTPPAYPADLSDKAKLMDSVSRGYKLFTGRAACISCHHDFGRQPAYRYDAWGTLVRPANLTAGAYRGGRRPLDLYWRVTRGIGPSRMPGLGVPVETNPPGTPPDKMKVTHGDAWDLVNFVQAMPYPAMLPPDVRDKIYGSAGAAAKVPTGHASAR